MSLLYHTFWFQYFFVFQTLVLSRLSPSILETPVRGEKKKLNRVDKPPPRQPENNLIVAKEQTEQTSKLLAEKDCIWKTEQEFSDSSPVIDLERKYHHHHRQRKPARRQSLIPPFTRNHPGGGTRRSSIEIAKLQNLYDHTCKKSKKDSNRKSFDKFLSKFNFLGLRRIIIIDYYLIYS